MLDYELFFEHIDDLQFPELFYKELDGFITLENVWDILARIQKGFVTTRVKKEIHGTIEQGAILKGENIFIGKGTVVESGAMICGPTIIGENVEIRHGAYIRGHVIIGNNSIVGHATEVNRSVMLPGAKAPHFNYVGDSILGSGTNLGAGTKLSNFKNDGSNVKTKIDGTIIETGIRKFGAILGDNCLLGCNSVTNPGTIMEKSCRVYPCATVNGYHKAGTILKLRQNIEQNHLITR